jgi:tetratricopeptide (TPR) repeat protein
MPRVVGRKLLFAVVTVGLFFGALEAACWLGGVRPLSAERDPFQGFADGVRVYTLDAERGVYRTDPRAVQHSFNDQEFRATKPANGFRVFVVGGSSAWGFPWGAGAAFARGLGDALQASREDRVVESVNAAAMSYGSHRLRIVAREVLSHAPDVLVVYEAHNEFVERRFYRDRLDGPGLLTRLRAAFERLHSYSALARALEAASREDHDAGDEPRSAGELLGLDVRREPSLGVGPAEREEARETLERNFRAILDDAARAGVRVVLCTVPSNVRDWVPNESVFAPTTGLMQQQDLKRGVAIGREALDRGDAAAAVAELERAAKIDPGYAEAQYRLGQAYEAVGRTEDSYRAYATARDTDGKPARAISAFNDTIRRLARERGALLVDAERLFEDESPGRLVGFNLIEDYVHPKPAGHRLIARAIWQALLEDGRLGAPRVADPEVFARAVPAAQGTSGPATAEPEAAGEARTPALLYNLAVVLENQGRFDEAMDKYRECIALDPGYFVARYNLGRLLTRAGQFREAEATHRETLRTAPDHVNSLIGLGEALRQQGRVEEARDAFARATAADARSAAAGDRLGVALAQLSAYNEAAAALARAVELDPRSAEFHVDFGFTLLAQARLVDAEREFEAALAQRRDHVRARNGLGAVRAEQGRLDEAAALFRESLSLDPRDGFARRALEQLKR